MMRGLTIAGIWPRVCRIGSRPADKIESSAWDDIFNVNPDGASARGGGQPEGLQFALSDPPALAAFMNEPASKQLDSAQESTLPRLTIASSSSPETFTRPDCVSSVAVAGRSPRRFDN